MTLMPGNICYTRGPNRSLGKYRRVAVIFMAVWVHSSFIKRYITDLSFKPLHHTMIAFPFAVAISTIAAFHGVHASPISSHKFVRQTDTPNFSYPIPKINGTLPAGYELDVRARLVLCRRTIY
jgi:hypothetical protein